MAAKKAASAFAFRFAFAVIVIFGTVNPYFSAYTIGRDFATTYPVAIALGLGAWFALGAVIFPLTRALYNTISTAILLAAVIFVLIYTGAPLTTAAWWQTSGAAIGGATLGWLMVSTFWWKWMRGIIGVDDADT